LKLKFPANEWEFGGNQAGGMYWGNRRPTSVCCTAAVLPGLVRLDSRCCRHCESQGQKTAHVRGRFWSIVGLQTQWKELAILSHDLPTHRLDDGRRGSKLFIVWVRFAPAHVYMGGKCLHRCQWGCRAEWGVL